MKKHYFILLLFFVVCANPVFAQTRTAWVAAKSGGFHFRREADLWVDTRDNSELFSKLSALATLQAGETVTLN